MWAVHVRVRERMCVVEWQVEESGEWKVAGMEPEESVDEKANEGRWGGGGGFRE